MSDFDEFDDQNIHTDDMRVLNDLQRMIKGLRIVSGGSLVPIPVEATTEDGDVQIEMPL